MKYADVILPLAVGGMYTYAVPSRLESQVRTGVPVLVPFASDKRYTAVVAAVHENRPEGFEVRELDGLADGHLVIGPVHLKFLLWMSGYYMAYPGEVLKAALPVIFRLESYTVVTRTDLEADSEVLDRSEKVFLEGLKPGESVSVKEAGVRTGMKNPVAVVKSLLSKGYVEVKERIDSLFREKKEYVVRWARSFTEDEKREWSGRLGRAAAQAGMLSFWMEQGRDEWERTDFLKASGGSAAVLKALCGRGILRVDCRISSRWETEGDCPEGSMHPLTPGQQEAYSSILSLFRTKDCVLLRGVTSSGKTEVYIHLIREWLSRGSQVLYMLPEIALTVQMVRRLKAVFGDDIGIYHSGMSDQMRAELWRRQCSDRPFGLIVGVRSSIFLPFTRLGLVIVDEEHDASYKQKEPAPRYNGRDAAIMLGKMYGARILLGTATPSFESWHNAREGKYGLVEMQVRYGGVAMPELEFADLSECRRKKRMQGSFTPHLVEEMGKSLEAGKQVILFQNRRGYSSYIQCGQCGDIPRCRHCDVSMTYYKQRNIMVCRYCGAMVPVPVQCPHCGGTYGERTPGTEKVEEEVSRLFPGVRVARMDAEVMGSRSRYRKVIGSFEDGSCDVLVGTQMVTKGLDFGNVGLVGVMNADHMVNIPDFRSEERAFSMLMQVSGRCGRREERGKVVIQAGDLKNRVLSMVEKGDFPAFYDVLAEERKLFGYPPFGRMIRMEMRHREVVVLREAANWLAGKLRERLDRRICGPAVPEVGRINGLYRLVLLVKMENGLPLSGVKRFLLQEEETLHGRPEWKNIRLVFDVDP